MYLRPVIAGGVGKYVAIVIEATGCYWLIQLFRCLQLSAGIFIPETEAPIRAYRCQSAMDRVKGDSIYLQQRNKYNK